MIEFFVNLAILFSTWIVLMFIPGLQPFGLYLLCALVPIATLLTITRQAIRLKELENRLIESQQRATTLYSSTETTGSTPITNENQRGQPGVININLADEVSIAQLPTIGPIVAKRIIQERENKPFASLDDFAARCELKPHQVERIRHLVLLAGPQKKEGLWGKLFGRAKKDPLTETTKVEEEKGKVGKGRIIDY